MLMDFFRLPEKRALRGFSTGQKNQFEVILALCQGADYILMDEPFAGNDVFNREDFYKVLLGILEPTETILLSTHLLEEVQHFISRAVLLRSGRIAGDVTTAALEERSQSLMDYVRSACGYEPGRVLQALERMDGRGRNSHAEISAALSPPGRSVRRPAGGGLRRRAGAAGRRYPTGRSHWPETPRPLTGWSSPGCPPAAITCSGTAPFLPPRRKRPKPAFPTPARGRAGSLSWTRMCWSSLPA
ncbi:MAG: hypothetical protein ACLRNQ_29335 [Flavonifractor plautii]